MNLTDVNFVQKRDRHARPFRKLVVLGDSHVAQNIWPARVQQLLRQFQGAEVTLINSGIGGNVISPRSPGYADSVQPSACERYRQDVIAHQPDLTVVSLGFSDMRAGMPVTEFGEDLSTIVAAIRRECDGVIVLTTLYTMSAYNIYPPFDRGSVEASGVYNQVISQVAAQYDTLLADIWAAQAGAPWVVSADTVHSNPLGYELVAYAVFQAIAANCSGAAYAFHLEPAQREHELLEKHEAALQRMQQRRATLADSAPELGRAGHSV